MAALEGLPLRAVFGGWMAQGFGLTLGLLVCGGLYFAASVTPFINRRTWRTLDDEPADASGPAEPVGDQPATTTAVAGTADLERDGEAQPVHGR